MGNGGRGERASEEVAGGSKERKKRNRKRKKKGPRDFASSFSKFRSCSHTRYRQYWGSCEREGSAAPCSCRQQVERRDEEKSAAVVGGKREAIGR